MHALLKRDEEEEEEEEEETVLDAPGGTAHGGGGGGGGGGGPLQQRRPAAASAAEGDEEEEDDDAQSQSTASIPGDDIPPPPPPGEMPLMEEDDMDAAAPSVAGQGNGAAAHAPAAAASAASAGSAGGGGGHGEGTPPPPHPAAELLAAFERVMGLAGMKLQAELRALERFRRAAHAYARGGAGPEFVALATEATAAFNALWVGVSDRLKAKRAAPAVSVENVAYDIRRRLAASGLGERAAAVMAGPSVEPLRQELARVLAERGWGEADLEMRGRELVQAKERAAQAASWFGGLLRVAPDGTTPAWRAATEANAAGFAARAAEAGGVLERHDAAMRLRRAIVEVRPLVASLQHRQGPRAAALQENHESRLFALWGGFVTAVSLGQGSRAGGAGAGAV